MIESWHAEFLPGVPVSGSAPEVSFRLPSWPTACWKWVEFVRDDGLTWYGSFEQGEIEEWCSIVPVWGTSDQFVVLSCGAPYWISAATRRVHYPPMSCRISQLKPANGSSVVVAAEDTSVLILAADGVAFQEHIALDWVRLTEVRGVEVLGVAEQGQLGDDRPFALNVQAHSVRWLGAGPA